MQDRNDMRFFAEVVDQNRTASPQRPVSSACRDQD